jgi:hypothetical protein
VRRVCHQAVDSVELLISRQSRRDRIGPGLTLADHAVDQQRHGGEDEDDGEDDEDHGRLRP